MSINYLSSYLSNLPAIQSRQTLKLLSQMQATGEIKTYSEFQNKLDELSKILQKDELKVRTPSFRFADGDLLESDAMRTFLQFLQQDMEALLGEAENISNTTRAHHRILIENYFTVIEAAVTELEKKIQSYEILLSRRYRGFGDVRVFDFDSMSVSGAEPVGFAIKDPREAEELDWSPPQKWEGGVHLGIDEKYPTEIHYFSDVEIHTDSDTPQSALTFSSHRSLPVNLIDGDARTIWDYSVYLKKENDPGACKVKLGLRFPGRQRINSLYIDGCAEFPLTIDSVSYMNDSNQEISITIPTLPSNSSFDIQLGDITTRKLILTIQQNSQSSSLVELSKADQYRARSVTDDEMLITELIGSDDLDISAYKPDASPTTDDYIKYSFALKNVYAKSFRYSPNGVFTLAPIDTKPLTSLAVQSEIIHPADDTVDAEITIKKENLYTDPTSGYSYVMDTEVFPILPYGSTTVDEKLPLTKTFGSVINTGELRFYPDFSASFAVYCNGSALTIGDEYTISVDNGTTWESTVSVAGIPLVPKTCLIKIVSPIAAIYTVSYTPLISTQSAGGEVYLNENKTVWLDRYQTYLFKNTRLLAEVGACRLTVQILIRSGTFNTRVSALVKDLTLLLGTK